MYQELKKSKLLIWKREICAKNIYVSQAVVVTIWPFKYFKLFANCLLCIIYIQISNVWDIFVEHFSKVAWEPFCEVNSIVY